MDRHCRRVWQVADCHAQTCGTWRRTSASLSAEARPPAASSWCVPNTFPPAAPDAPSPHTAYQKLWISPITVMVIEYSPVSVFPSTGHSPKEKRTLCSAKTSPSFAPYIHNTARTAFSSVLWHTISVPERSTSQVS